MENYKHTEVTELIIKCFYNVYNQLGYGFLERVYQRAMMIELCKFAVNCEQQKSLKVFYEGVEIGDYYADLVVDDCVIVELKAVEKLAPEHEVQLVNYLKATGIEVGLLLNFGPKTQVKRKVFSKDYLKHHK